MGIDVEVELFMLGEEVIEEGELNIVSVLEYYIPIKINCSSIPSSVLMFIYFHCSCHASDDTPNY